jgi:hypothetical protein
MLVLGGPIGVERGSNGNPWRKIEGNPWLRREKQTYPLYFAILTLELK